MTAPVDSCGNFRPNKNGKPNGDYMKRLLILLVLPTIAWAQTSTPKKIGTDFSGRSVIQHVLESEALHEMESEKLLGDLVSVELQKDGEGVSAVYQVYMRYSKAGLGPRGPSRRPCNVVATVGIEIKRRGRPAITYSELGQPELRGPVCAENAPRFPR